MTLHEAVVEAKEEGFKWLSIDDNKGVFAYSAEPMLGRRVWEVSEPQNYIFLGYCESPLGNSFIDWLIDLEELTL